MVTLPQGSRVVDAIDAAGGATEAGDLDRANLAGLLRDGDQIHVFPQPGMGTEEPTPDDSFLATPQGGEVVYINRASAEELQTLPGIGPALAARIIEYRETNGPFTSMEDLDAVSGIGPALLEDLEGLISFE
jgi:competence protein ComEA